MKQKLMVMMFAAVMVGCGSGKQVDTLGVDEFAEVAGRHDVRLVDVRTPDEYAEGHLFGAENIDVNAADFAERIEGITGTVAVYCRGGRRSLKAAEQMAAQGCKVYNLDGGIMAWQKAGRPTTTVETDVFATPTGKLVKFHALMHASICIEYDGRTFYVDPVARLRDRTVDYGAMPKADILFVTHEHFDHYDSATVSALCMDGRTQGCAPTTVVMNKRCAEMYGSGTAMANGDYLQLAEDITVEAVPAYNTTPEHMQFHPQGRDNGYVLTLGGLRIYVAGDSEDIPEMAALRDIDIAFLPCNQPFTMTPGQLVGAARMVKPRVLFPYHYGETDLSGIPAQLTDIDVRIRHYE